MNERDRLTPISRRRERGVRWANESVWGERFARWLGSAFGGVQLRLERIRPSSSDIPWTPLRRPLAQATVALVSTAGIHLCADTPFELKSDASFRLIPRTARTTDLCITHEHYDRRDAARDPNLVFPLERLLELEAEGIVGHVADAHYGFGFTDDPVDLLAPGREVGALLAQAGVDLALLVPA
ncbi:MAG TPA: glycine/sarcosine/betaine reductase selenoprotein B family protein [Ktedonobacterales bacterium]